MACFWRGAQTLTSGWGGGQLVVCDSGDPPFKGPGGKLCDEMERVLAAEAGSMGLSLRSWVALLTEAFERKIGFTSVWREERPAFKGGKREREAKTENRNKTRQTAAGCGQGTKREKLQGVTDVGFCLGPLRVGEPQQRPWNRKAGGSRTLGAVNQQNVSVVKCEKKKEKHVIAQWYILAPGSFPGPHDEHLPKAQVHRRPPTPHPTPPLWPSR